MMHHHGGEHSASVFYQHTTHLWILDKLLKAVDKVGAVEGIAADANDGRLPQAMLRRLKYRLRIVMIRATITLHVYINKTTKRTS